MGGSGRVLRILLCRKAACLESDIEGYTEGRTCIMQFSGLVCGPVCVADCN